MRVLTLVGAASWLLSMVVSSGGIASSDARSGTWGVAVGLRQASIAIAAPDRQTSDVVPLLFYEGERVFMDGLEGGVHLYRDAHLTVSALARIRFFDKPRGTRGEIKSDARDVGLQFRLNLSDDITARGELMSAGNGRHYADAGIAARYGNEFREVRPYLGLRLKSSRFNDHYLGLDQQEIGAGVDVRGTVIGRRHLSGNLYLLGGATIVWLDGAARRDRSIRDDFSWDVFAGLGLFDRPDGVAPGMRNAPYVRAAWGWATPSNLGEIIRFDVRSDVDDNSLGSLFYGHPLAGKLFGLPLDLYVTTGLVTHHRSQVQNRALEYVVGIKGFHTFKWPVRVRLGLAEGLSYASRISFVERTELERKDYRPSKLLNYLDLTLDVSIGDLLRKRSLENLWLGYGIHHRSGIFETGSQFGRIHGGSNYNTIYLQRHF
jgi:MipA family protein